MKISIYLVRRCLAYASLGLSVATAAPQDVCGASMADYCVVPPNMATSAKPNVNVVMDYSGSMQLPAYLSCSTGETDEKGVLTCASAGGPFYDQGKNYYGYFDRNLYYKYESSRFSPNSTCADSNLIGSAGCISGNLLNWITTTRVDAVRKALIGGRTTTGKAIVLESEGAALSYTDTNLGCTFSITAPSVGNRVLDVSNAPGGSCVLGSLSKGNVKIDPGATVPAGIIDKFYPNKIDLEFTIFKTGDAGLVRAAKNPTRSSLAAAIGNEAPLGGTPTGEALWEAYDFFKQSNDHTYAANNDQIHSGNDVKDPYYRNNGAVTCRKSFVLLISDGAWNGVVDPVVPAHKLRTEDLRTLPGDQQGAVYVIHAFGDNDSDVKSQGRNALISTAIFGGFKDRNGDGWPYPFSGYTAGSITTCDTLGNTPRSALVTTNQTYCNSRGVTYPLDNCSPSSWNSLCAEWGRRADGLPYNFFDAEEGSALERVIEQAFKSILTGLTSGTSASFVNSSTGSGAALVQALFFPNKRFEAEEIAWTGELQSLWYYIDPFLEKSSIREETAYTSGDHVLDLTQDYVLTYEFDKDNGKTKVSRFSDTTGKGTPLVAAGTATPDTVGVNWRAGETLRMTAPADRKIFTTTDGLSLIDFKTANAMGLSPFLSAANPAEIISYIRGDDAPDTSAPDKYRSRGATIGGQTKSWKLGDIISSSPKAQSAFPLNIYQVAPPNGYGDQTYADFVRSSTYKNRTSVYVGANDGMLHAFNLGVMSHVNKGSQKAKLTGTDLGKEAWAYVPKGTLPYLKYLADPLYDHLYYVDGPLRIFDASIHAVEGEDCSSTTYWDCKRVTKLSDNAVVEAETSWRTILIGGMGIGGAVREESSTCSTTEDCVKRPGGVSGSAGYSSYFALDVTDDAGSPKLLWEFAGDSKGLGTLGFATVGPAIVRVGDKYKNGRWFAVFGSGPTGPIDVSSRQFLGRSDQNLRLFVVDLATGTLVTTIDTDVDGQPLAVNAFAGSLSGAVVDTDKWNPGSAGFYSDDVVYVGYVKKDGNNGWTKGGVLRVATKASTDPKQWVVSRLIDNTGPVTTSIAKLQDRKNKDLWIHFGTGRYFYKTDAGIDSPDAGQAIYGVREPCYSGANIFSSECKTTVEKADLVNQTSSPSPLSKAAAGWIINLDGSSGDNKAERVITDPVAAHTGAVFFTTYRPTDEPCGFGGESFIWAVRYDSGGKPPAAAMQGKALVQVSTGALAETDLANGFAAKDGRRSTVGIAGMPPAAQGLAILVKPKPARKLLHVQER